MLRSRVASALRPPNILWARLLQWGLILIILQAVLSSDRIKIITQSIADNFAKRIKEYPVDWHMLQRIWIDEEH